MPDPTSCSVRSWAVRPFRESDYPSLVRLMAEAYGPDHRSAREAFLRWQYDRNPLGRAIGYVAVAAGEEIVGAYTLIPWPLCLGGQPRVGMLSLNTATSPRYQKQGIFVATAEPAYREAARQGAAGVIGFPNQHSLHGLVHRLGWTCLGRMRAYLKPRKVGTVISAWLAARSWQRGGVAPAPGLASRAADRVNRAWFHAGADGCEVGGPTEAAIALLAAPNAAPRSSLGLGYPPDWARWRYGTSPLWRYEWVSAPGEDAVAICRHGTMWGVRTTLLVDFGARWKRLDAPRLLARAIEGACRRADEEDSAQVLALISPGHPASRALARAGFLRVPNRFLPHGAHACYRPLADPAVPSDFATWRIAVGAYDAG